MNGPLSMYKLKPVVQCLDSVELSPTMYKMKNVVNNRTSLQGRNETIFSPNIMEQVNKILQKPDQEIEELEMRQKAMLKQLYYLKEQMSVLKEQVVRKSSGDTCSQQASISSVVYQTNSTEQPWSGATEEIVLHSSPDYPPFSLLALSHLWPGLKLLVTCHTHSSIITLPAHLGIFNTLAHTPSPGLHIRIIWKQMGPDCELVVSPLTHCPIRGEVNLLRYLHRSLTTLDVISDVLLDSLLDICHRLRHARTLRDKQLAVRSLNAKLGKAPWLLGKDLSVADVAAWSAVRSVSGVELSQNMTKWHNRCGDAFGVGKEFCISMQAWYLGFIRI